jgi:hypothetical protein
VEIAFSVDGAGREWLWLQEPGEDGCSGFELLPDMRGNWLTYNLALLIQDQFFLETRQTRGQARPPCPNHAHPACPEIRDNQAWWICPRDQRSIAPIGELAAATT